MRQFILQATIEQSTTTQGIQARDNFSAKVLAVQKINANYVADKRYATGEIILKDALGKVVWRIKIEEAIKPTKDKEVK